MDSEKGERYVLKYFLIVKIPIQEREKIRSDHFIWNYYLILILERKGVLIGESTPTAK